MIKEGLDHTKPMTYNEYINRLYESESGMPQNVRLCVYFWVNDRYGETGGKNNYMEYSCQINWVDGLDGGELMEHLWQEVYKHCLDPDIEVCSSCAKIRHFYMFHRNNYYIQSAKDWDHMRICPIAPKNDDKWDSSLEFWQTVKYNEKMRFFKSWFSKKPRDVQFRRKKNESLLDTYVSCEFNAIFVTPKHAEFLEGRDERIKEAEKKHKDETLAKLSFPIKGCSLNCSIHHPHNHSYYHSSLFILLSTLTLTLSLFMCFLLRTTYFCCICTL